MTDMLRFPAQDRAFAPFASLPPLATPMPDTPNTSPNTSPNISRKPSFIALRWRELISRIKVHRAQQRLKRSAAELACEHLVSQTNPALRGMPGYRRRLLPVAEKILAHGDALLGAVPGPSLLDTTAWSTDPLVNAFFADVQRLRQVVSGRAVQRWLGDHPGFDGDLYGLLVAMPEERQQLGMELLGDKVRRDVKQTILAFKEAEILAVADSMDALHAALRQPMADFLVSIGLGRIAAREERIAELEEALAMLRTKQRALLRPRVGNTRLAQGGGSLPAGDVERLEADIEETQGDLADARRGFANIRDYLASIITELDHPERELYLETMDLWVDRMNVVRDRRCEGAREIRLVRARRSDRPGRVAQYVRFPCSLVLDVDARLADIERQIGG